MNLPLSKVKNMGGGVVIDLEHNDDYGESVLQIQLPLQYVASVGSG
jgi:hypothetical protein